MKSQQEIKEEILPDTVWSIAIKKHAIFQVLGTHQLLKNDFETWARMVVNSANEFCQSYLRLHPESSLKYSKQWTGRILQNAVQQTYVSEGAEEIKSYKKNNVYFLVSMLEQLAQTQQAEPFYQQLYQRLSEDLRYADFLRMKIDLADLAKICQSPNFGFDFGHEFNELLKRKTNPPVAETIKALFGINIDFSHSKISLKGNDGQMHNDDSLEIAELSGDKKTPIVTLNGEFAKIFSDNINPLKESFNTSETLKIEGLSSSAKSYSQNADFDNSHDALVKEILKFINIDSLEIAESSGNNKEKFVTLRGKFPVEKFSDNINPSQECFNTTKILKIEGLSSLAKSHCQNADFANSPYALVTKILKFIADKETDTNLFSCPTFFSPGRLIRHRALDDLVKLAEKFLTCDSTSDCQDLLRTEGDLIGNIKAAGYDEILKAAGYDEILTKIDPKIKVVNEETPLLSSQNG